MALTLKIQRKTPGLLRKLIDAFKKSSPEVQVGFPAGVAKQANIEKAIWNEFGTRGGASGGGWGGPIPERPFMRNAMKNNENKYRAAMKGQAPKILNGKVKPTMVLEKLGIMAQSDIQQEITTLVSPPNSPVTIARKGSSNPLIDTGEMRQAVTYRVKP